MASEPIKIPTEFETAKEVTADGRIRKIIIREGETAVDFPTRGCTVSLNYTGTFEDDRIFDSNLESGEPFKATVGINQVIKGWDAVLVTMRKREKARVWIAPEYAYGPMGHGQIPGDTPLIFNMELLDVDFTGEDITENSDGGICKITIDDSECDPNDNTPIVETMPLTINFTRNSTETFENFTYIVGEESLHPELLPGVNECVKTLKLHECSRFTLKPRTAYNPLLEQTVFEITVIDHERTMPVYDMNEKEKYARGLVTKEIGTDFLKQGEYAVAMRKFEHTLDCLSFMPVHMQKDTDTVEKWCNLKLATYLNSALICLKLKDYHQAVKHCDEILNGPRMHSMNEKALFRKAEAMFGLRDFNSAEKWYNFVLKQNPKNVAAIRRMKEVKAAQLKWKADEKKRYAKMFQN